MNNVKLTTKFGEANLNYKKFRPGYPKELFDVILSNVESPYHKAIDIGAGTGISTEILAEYFNNVIAIEPDEKMISVGLFPDGVTLINDCAENVQLPKGEFDLVTVGNAFYWMDAVQVLPLISEWLTDKGILAAYRYNLPMTDNNNINKIILNELEEKWDVFRHDRLKDTEYTYRNIRSSPYFNNVRISKIENIVQLSISSLIGFFASTSYVSSFIKTLSNPQDYLDEISQKIYEVSNNEMINVDFGLELVLAYKK